MLQSAVFSLKFLLIHYRSWVLVTDFVPWKSGSPEHKSLGGKKSLFFQITGTLMSRNKVPKPKSQKIWWMASSEFYWVGSLLMILENLACGKVLGQVSWGKNSANRISCRKYWTVFDNSTRRKIGQKWLEDLYWGQNSPGKYKKKCIICLNDS